MSRCTSCGGSMRAVYYCENADCPNQNPLTQDNSRLWGLLYRLQRADKTNDVRLILDTVKEVLEAAGQEQSGRA